MREEAEAKELRSPLQRAYLPVLRFATQRRWITLAIGVVIFARDDGAGARNLKTNFLDSAGMNTHQRRPRRCRVGTNLEVTDAAARKVEQVLADEPGVASYQVNVGGGEPVHGRRRRRRRPAVVLGDAGGGRRRDPRCRTACERSWRRWAPAWARSPSAAGRGAAGCRPTSCRCSCRAPTSTSCARLRPTVAQALAGGAGPAGCDLQPGGQRRADRGPRQPRGGRRARPDRGAGSASEVATAFRGAPVRSIDIDGRAADIVLRTGDAPEDLAAVEDLELPTAAGMVKLSGRWPRSSRRPARPRSAAWTASARRPSRVTPSASNLGAVTTDVTARLDTAEPARRGHRDAWAAPRPTRPTRSPTWGLAMLAGHRDRLHDHGGDVLRASSSR